MSRSQQMLEMIERGLNKMSAEKMHAIMQTFREIQADERREKFHAAFARLHPNLPAVAKRGDLIIKNKEGVVIQRSKYALWEDVHRAVMPILASHEFMLTFKTEAAPDGKLRMTGVLGHGGHEITSQYDLPIDTSGSKNNLQGVGSSTTYGERYLTVVMLNLRMEGEDNDGQGAPGAAPGAGLIDDEQYKSILAKLDQLGKARDAGLAALLEWAHVETVQQLPASKYKQAMNALTKRAEGSRG
jgi:hypothetical protein